MTTHSLITGIHHVQITIPTGQEDAARRFYCDLLGLPEIEKPASMKERGGFWVQIGDRQLHIGTEEGTDRTATKAHIAYRVSDMDAMRTLLTGAGVEFREGTPIPGTARIKLRDPFGNDVEFIQLLADQQSLRTSYSSGTEWEAAAGYSRAVRVGDLVHVAGTTATAEDGSLVGVGDAYAQTVQTLHNIERGLEAVGASLADVVRTRMFVTDITQWEAVTRAHGEFFAGVRPVATLLEVSALIHPDMLVEIEVEAIITPT